MPEIGEVARVVDAIRRHLVNRTIKICEGFDDDIVYGKVGTSAKAFQSAVTNKKVTGVGQQGKYFYMTFSSPPHAVMHLGMTGWVKFSTEDTAYYKQAKEVERGEQEWPPKYMKFLLKCEAEGEKEAVEVAFVDARRLARIRLVECGAGDIRNQSPLKENGPDPVIDRDVVTVEWLGELLGRKRVPVKALLLDQANLSGVGNWVADEVLYQARIHPEQYSNTFGEEQIKRLHDALIGVCSTAVGTLADSTQFPENWLMKYRWDAGKKDKNVLPNGEKIVHLKVGGRTSAIVPTVQKKTAPVAGDVASDAEGRTKEKPAPRGKRKAKDDDAADEDVKQNVRQEEVEKKPTRTSRSKKTKTESEEAEPVAKPQTNKGKAGRGSKADLNEKAEEPADSGAIEQEEPKAAKASQKSKQAKTKKAEKVPTPGERRSTRTRGK
ncbi:hypothetical protein MBLNU230_g3758t1 [Neophaeotheca triangularis]